MYKPFAVIAFLLALTAASCGIATDETATAATDWGSFSWAIGAEPERYTLHPRHKPDLVVATTSPTYTAGDTLHLVSATEEKHALWYRWDNELRIFDDKCLRAEESEHGATLTVGDCGQPSATSFTFTDDGLKWASKSLCLTVAGDELREDAAIVLAECQDGAQGQGFGVRAVQGSNAGQPAPAAPAEHKQSPTPDKAQVVPTPKPAPAPKPAHESAHETKPAKPAEPAPKPTPQAPAVPKPAAPAVVASDSAFGPSPAGTLVAPYFYDWGSPHGFAKTLLEVYAKGGVSAATIAFGLSGGGCKVAGFGDIGPDIKAFRAKGGTVVLSFGGASGTYLQATCQDAGQLAASILGEMRKYDTHMIDFDVEGSDKGVNRVTDPKSNGALVAALAEISKQDPQASISFTLAADDGSGLGGDGYKLLQMAANKGVKVARVNLMAMDYGHKPAQGKTAGDLAIACAEKAAAQMAKIWPHAEAKDIYHAIGITPMIGQNDGNQDAPFLPTDADKVATYAKAKGIGLLAYWAMQRDLAARGDYNDHSNNQQSDYQYFKALSAAQK